MRPAKKRGGPTVRREKARRVSERARRHYGEGGREGGLGTKLLYTAAKRMKLREDEWEQRDEIVSGPI